jgi:predicted amidohydrolase
MRIIGVELAIVWESKLTNCDAVRKTLERARPPKESLIVLTEMFATGYSMNAGSTAEPVRGETELFLSGIARKHASFLIAGTATKAKTGKGRNEAIMFDTQGREIARYCKRHPFACAGEDKYYEAGRDIVVSPLNGFMVAPFICYDLRFPEDFRSAVRGGANCFVVIANWPEVRQNHWPILLRARAIENQSYVVGVNRRGMDPKNRYPGLSTVIDPLGNIVAEADANDGLLVADIEADMVVAIRQQFPFSADMREVAG